MGISIKTEFAQECGSGVAGVKNLLLHLEEMTQSRRLSYADRMAAQAALNLIKGWG